MVASQLVLEKSTQEFVDTADELVVMLTSDANKLRHLVATPFSVYRPCGNHLLKLMATLTRLISNADKCD